MHPIHGIFHTFTCAQPHARPTQQMFFFTALHRRIIWSITSSQLSAQRRTTHCFIFVSERTTHPTHGLPHPTQGHTTFHLRLREEPHTQLMGFLTPHRGTQRSFSVSERNTPISWAHPTHGLSLRLTHSVCILEDVSRSCNHRQYLLTHTHTHTHTHMRFSVV